MTDEGLALLSDDEVKAALKEYGDDEYWEFPEEWLPRIGEVIAVTRLAQARKQEATARALIDKMYKTFLVQAERKDQEIERLKVRLAEDVKLAVNTRDKDWADYFERHKAQGQDPRVHYGYYFHFSDLDNRMKALEDRKERGNEL